MNNSIHIVIMENELLVELVGPGSWEECLAWIEQEENKLDLGQMRILDEHGVVTFGDKSYRLECSKPLPAEILMPDKKKQL